MRGLGLERETACRRIRRSDRRVGQRHTGQAGLSRRERALPLVIAFAAAIVTTTATAPRTAWADLYETRATPAEQASFGGGSPEDWKTSEQAWREMIASEDLVDALGSARSALSRSIRNLALPDAEARRWFAAGYEVVDLAGDPFETNPSPLPALAPVSRRELHAGPTTKDGPIWPGLLSRLDRVDHVSLGVLRGRFLEPERRRFETLLKLEALGRLPSGPLAWVHGRAVVRWEREGERPVGEADSWRIVRWETEELTVHETVSPLFREVLDLAVPDSASRRSARRSVHEELVSRALAEKAAFTPPHPHFSLKSLDRHPAVSVVDIDRDGDDDFYAVEREGKNLLFVNRGDGTFEEKGAAWGLDFDGRSQVSLFADFDNDGDPDLFLGRSLAPSLLLRNDGSSFTDVTATALGGEGPKLATSASAADVDGDGLVDLYVATYASDMLMKEVEAARPGVARGGAAPGSLLAAMLPERDSRLLARLARHPDAHEFRRLPGPPNLLLHNEGGLRFEEVTDSPLRLFYNTYQAAWSDYDDDGDPDVYVANDFAPNQMMRNDGGGRFTDVTEATDTSDIGFGMGVSWSDYDGDRRPDLYVTNMYSKAGSRITSMLGALDPTFRKMAEGNSLFRNEGERFRRVSGQHPPAVPVEVAGWSWGSQFADFDGDTRPDLFAMSGNYTAPREHELPVDI